MEITQCAKLAIFSWEGNVIVTLIITWGSNMFPSSRTFPGFRWSIECSVLAAVALLKLSRSGSGQWLHERLPRNLMHADLSAMMKEKQNINCIFNCKAWQYTDIIPLPCLYQ